jgi:hypothetical protein
MRNSTRKKRFDPTELMRDMHTHQHRLRHLRSERRVLQTTLHHLEVDTGLPAVRTEIAAIKKEINSIGDSIAEVTREKQYIDRCLLERQAQKAGNELPA